MPENEEEVMGSYFEIRVSTKKKLKKYCKDQDKKMGKIVDKAILAYLYANE